MALEHFSTQFAIDPNPGFPGFVFPIFGDTSKSYTQIPDRLGDRIAGFVEENGRYVHTVHYRTLEAKIGDEVVFAFSFGEGEAVVGGCEFVISAVRARNEIQSPLIHAQLDAMDLAGRGRSNYYYANRIIASQYDKFAVNSFLRTLEIQVIQNVLRTAIDSEKLKEFSEHLSAIARECSLANELLVPDSLWEKIEDIFVVDRRSLRERVARELGLDPRRGRLSDWDRRFSEYETQPQSPQTSDTDDEDWRDIPVAFENVLRREAPEERMFVLLSAMLRSDKLVRAIIDIFSDDHRYVEQCLDILRRSKFPKMSKRERLIFAADYLRTAFLITNPARRDIFSYYLFAYMKRFRVISAKFDKILGQDSLPLFRDENLEDNSIALCVADLSDLEKDPLAGLEFANATDDNPFGLGIHLKRITENYLGEQPEQNSEDQSVERRRALL
jgi:hypothetical protein